MEFLGPLGWTIFFGLLAACVYWAYHGARATFLIKRKDRTEREIRKFDKPSIVFTFLALGFLLLTWIGIVASELIWACGMREHVFSDAPEPFGASVWYPAIILSLIGTYGATAAAFVGAFVQRLWKMKIASFITALISAGGIWIAMGFTMIKPVRF